MKVGKSFLTLFRGISLPGKITDIYIAQDNINIQSEGYVYVDDLTFYQESTATTTKTSLPRDIKEQDELQKHSELENDDFFRIAVIDKMGTSNLMIDKLKNLKIEESINNNSDVVIFTSNVISSALENIDVEKFYFSNYSTMDYKNSKFISIDCSKSGIRNSDSTQWVNIQNDIKNAKADNIFIVMNNSLDNFSDNDEVSFWIDMLCDLRREFNKNIWVLHYGIYTDYSMERGIKYLGINNATNIDEIPNNTNYILITVNGKNLSYEIKNIFK